MKYVPIPTNDALKYRNNTPDAHNLAPIKAISDGEGMPCRHCLEDIAKGDAYLTLAYCPFDQKHAYAEIGPIFIHVKNCVAYNQSEIPTSFLNRQYYMMRAYDKHTKGIVEGSGQRVKPDNITEVAEQLFENDNVEFIHIRSATNTCFACKIVSS